MSLPESSGISKDDFHHSRSIALTENHHFSFHNKYNLPALTINFSTFSRLESHQTYKENLFSLPFIFVLGFCRDLQTVCKSHVWIFQEQLCLSQYLSELFSWHYWSTWYTLTELTPLQNIEMESTSDNKFTKDN